jgi:hypothetical protein
MVNTVINIATVQADANTGKMICTYLIYILLKVFGNNPPGKLYLFETYST